MNPRTIWRVLKQAGPILALFLLGAALAAGQTAPGPPSITNAGPQPVDISGVSAVLGISGTGLASTCNPTAGIASNIFPPPVVHLGALNVSNNITGANAGAIQLSIPSSSLIPYQGQTLNLDVSVYMVVVISDRSVCSPVDSNAFPVTIGFTVPAPALMFINPGSTTACGPGFQMILSGSNFVNGAVAAIGTDLNQGDFQIFPETSGNSSQFAVNITPSSAFPGVTNQTTLQVWAGNPYSSTGYRSSVNSVPFLVYPTPVAQSVSPNTVTAGGTAAVQLQVTVSNYVSGTTKVLWGGKPLAVVTETQQTSNLYVVTVTLPASMIPTPAAGSTQTVQVTAVNQDAANPNLTAYATSCSAPANVTVNNPAALILTTQAPIQDGEVGLKYSQTFAAGGGTTPYTFSMSPAIGGLTLDPKSGILSGTPATAGNTSFSVTVTDAASKTQNAQFSLTVYAQLAVPSGILPAGTVNVKYSQSIATSGGKPPLNWKVPSDSTPPAGLAVSSDGVVTWAQPTAGTFSFGVTVTDSLGAFAGPSMSLTINPAIAPLSFTTTSLPAATFGAGYSQRVAVTGGTAPYTYSATGLPSWLKLDGNTGALSGTPDAPGTSNITFTVTDSAAAKATQAVTLTVNLPSAPTLTIKPSTDAQPTLSLSLGASYPLDLMGVFSLSFTGNAAGLPTTYTPPDLQFASGGTSVTAKIAANSTSLTLPANQAIQLGSVAGTVTVSLTSLTAVLPGGQMSPLTVPSGTSTTITVARSKPAITGTVSLISKSSTGFTLEITRAVSNPRDLTSASVTFHAAAGAQLTGTTFTVPLNTGQPSTWWTSQNGLAAAGTFDLQIPFNYQGDVTALGSVDVTLTNSAGTSDVKSGN